MTWTLQLTVWALPPLLAVLVTLRDQLYLWPRRRERGATALGVLSASTGVWALASLVAVTTPALGEGLLLERLRYLAAAVAPLAWFVFTLSFARRKLVSWPMGVLGGLSALTVGLVLWAPGWRLLVRSAEIVPQDPAGALGLHLVHGPWNWVHLAVRTAAVVGGAGLLWRFLARSPQPGRRLAGLAGAVVLALAPMALHAAWGPGEAWTDLGATGFALASAVLVATLLKPRLQAVGPVARTLVMDELPDPIVVLDGRGRIVDVNRAAERVLGLRPYGDVPVALGTVWASSSRRAAPANITLGVDREGGLDTRTFEVSVTRLGDGVAPGRSALLLRDVTDRDRAERELARLARSDPLTGLANRRHFMDALDREIERSARYGRPLSLVLLDLDHFKKVNDTHGHAAGDDVLRQASRALQGVCRDVDLAARLGGEELALLLPETDGRGARVVAERVREQVAAAPHTSPDGATFRVTASLGVATLGPGAATGTALLQRADEALYRAKDGGRNRVRVAGG